MNGGASPLKRIGRGKHNLRWIVLAFTAFSLSFIGIFIVTLHNTEKSDKPVSAQHIRYRAPLHQEPNSISSSNSGNSSDSNSKSNSSNSESNSSTTPPVNEYLSDSSALANVDSTIDKGDPPGPDSLEHEYIPPAPPQEIFSIVDKNAVIPDQHVPDAAITNVSPGHRDGIIEETYPYGRINIARSGPDDPPFRALRQAHAQYLEFFDPKNDASSYSVYHTERVFSPVMPTEVNHSDDVLKRFHSTLQTGQVSNILIHID